MVIRHQKIFPDIQLFQQYEGQNGHLQSERKSQHLVARSEIGQGPKGETDGMV
jgi:hypothetical protein